MIPSIIKACSTPGVLEKLVPASFCGVSRPAEVRTLLDLISSLQLKHFGNVDPLRASYSVLPDSLLALEKKHPCLEKINLSNSPTKTSPNSKTHPFQWSHTNSSIQESPNLLDLDTKQLNASLFPTSSYLKKFQHRLHHSLDGSAEMTSNMLTLYSDPQKRFVLQVFMLPKGCVMPLHDHPNMTVITKVLKGAIDVTSYSYKSKQTQSISATGLNQIGEKLNEMHGTQETKPSWLTWGRELNLGREVVPSGRVVLKHQDNDQISQVSEAYQEVPTSSSHSLLEDLALLFPVDGNLHAMRALENTLFFDIMYPPYQNLGAGDCTYYKLEKVLLSDGKTVSVETELDSVHSSYPKSEEELSAHKWYIQPFDPAHFQCWEVPWHGEQYQF